MASNRFWYLHYEFGEHHCYIKVEWEQVCIILNNLCQEFEIHQDFDDSGRLYEVWIEDYYGEKHSVAHSEKKHI